MKKLIVALMLLVSPLAIAGPCVTEIEQFVSTSLSQGLRPSNYQMLDEATVIYEMTSADKTITSGFLLTLHSPSDADMAEMNVVKKGQCTYENKSFNFFILSTDRAVQAERKPPSNERSGS